MPPRPPISRTISNEWFDALTKRIASRRYDGTAVASPLLDRLEQTCHRLSVPGGAARAVLIREAPPEVFTGLIGSYGRVKDAPSAVAFVGPDDAAYEIGYVGEAVILDATPARLQTSCIAASFDAEHTGNLVELAEGEKVHAITALGHATETVSTSERLMRASLRARHRLPLDTIAPGHEQWPEWAREAAAAVRLAPSGANKQPWRLRMDGEALVMTAAAKTYWTAPIDFGIGMLHAEIGAAPSGVRGTWTAHSDSEVARFVPGAATQ
jgi:hypothetical protein